MPIVGVHAQVEAAKPMRERRPLPPPPPQLDNMDELPTDSQVTGLGLQGLGYRAWVTGLRHWVGEPGLKQAQQNANVTNIICHGLGFS